MNTMWKFLILVSMFFYSSFAQAKAWRGIEPLHSTREDVERLFGNKVVRCGGSACIYDLGEEIIFVLYATESNCKNDDATSAWKVPVGTVIEIGVRFKEDKLLSDLQFDLSKFERVEDKHLPGWIYYLNVDEGIRVEGGLKTASSVTYFQSAKDNHLRCPSAKQVKLLMRSTREDVERLLGQSQYTGYSAIYTVENGTLQVEYYPFNYCESQSGADLKVPRWTVVELTYTPDNPAKLPDLNLDLKKFRRVKESFDVPDLISYVNDEE